MKRHLLEQLVDAAKLAEKSRQEKLNAVRNQNFEKGAHYRDSEKNYEIMIDELLEELTDESGENKAAE